MESFTSRIRLTVKDIGIGRLDVLKNFLGKSNSRYLEIIVNFHLVETFQVSPLRE